MQHLPLFYYPTTAVFVDDNKTLLQCLELAFSKKIPLKTFDDPENCLIFIKKYISPLSKKTFIYSDKNSESYGLTDNIDINFKISSIVDIINDQNRYHEISSFIIDHKMPKMDGLTLSKAISPLNIYKILFSGTVDDETVITGFNNDAIQKMLKKSDPFFEIKLLHYIQLNELCFFQSKTHKLLLLLESENKLPQSDAYFIEFFKNIIKEKNIAEYYLIDKNGSLLCIDKNGYRFYFIIHTEKSIDNWLMTYASDCNTAQCIISREKIPFFGINKEAWQVDACIWGNYFYYANTITGREKYYYAIISNENKMQ